LNLADKTFASVHGGMIKTADGIREAVAKAVIRIDLGPLLQTHHPGGVAPSCQTKS
jgi:hypothetical protein